MKKWQKRILLNILKKKASTLTSSHWELGRVEEGIEIANEAVMNGIDIWHKKGKENEADRGGKDREECKKKKKKNENYILKKRTRQG